MNKLLFALIASLSVGSAMATSTHTCQGNSCNGTGGSTPSTSTSSSNSNSSSSATVNSSTHMSTTGIIVSKPNTNSSSSLSNSGNSTNTNSNTAVGGQGGKGGRSTSNSNATGGQGGAGGAGGNSSSTSTGGKGGEGGGGGTGVGSQGQSVSVDSHVEAMKRAAASATAAPLTSSNDTCMGSTSGGVQTPGFGISAGSTWTDKNCVMLKNSRELWNMGLKEAALARLCMDADNREAIEVTGMKCPARPAQSAGYSASSTASSGTYTGNDNIVRRRLGLPLVKE